MCAFPVAAFMSTVCTGLPKNHQFVARATTAMAKLNLAESVILAQPSSKSGPTVEEIELDDMTRSVILTPRALIPHPTAAVETSAPGIQVEVEHNDQIAVIGRQILATPPETESRALICVEDQHQIFQRELLQFQATCKDPVMNLMIDGVRALKQQVTQATRERDQVKIEKAELENLIGTYSRGLLMDIALKLYQIIKDSPELKRNFDELNLEGETVEVRQLLRELEKKSEKKAKPKNENLTDGWVSLRAGPDGKSMVVNMAIEDLKKQIEQVDNILKSRGNPQQFLVQLSELRKNIGPASIKWSNVAWNALIVASYVFQALSYMSAIAAPFLPLAVAIVPYIFPEQFLSLLKILVRGIKPLVQHIFS